MKRDRCNGDRNFIYLALSNVIDNNLNYNLINNIEILMLIESIIQKMSHEYINVLRINILGISS